MTLKSIVAASLLLFAGYSQAECVLPDVERPEADYVNCKAWPAHDNWDITLQALFRLDPSYAYNAGIRQGTYDIDLRVVDREDTGVLARYPRIGLYHSAELLLSNLEIDTGRYKVTPDNQAFGIRALFMREDGETDTRQALTLYLKEGAQLRPVLDNLGTLKITNARGNRCEGNTLYVERTVEISKEMTQGYADLIVRSVNKTMPQKMVNGQCTSHTMEGKRSQQVIKYNGKQYVVPANLKAF